MVDLAANCVHQWKLEDVTDSVGGNNLTLYGSPPFVAAKLGNGLYLSSEGKYAMCNKVTMSAPSSLTCWLKCVLTPYTTSLFATNTDLSGLSAETMGSPRITGYITDMPNYTEVQWNLDEEFDFSEWHFFVFNFDTGGIELFVDGVSCGVQETPYTFEFDNLGNWLTSAWGNHIIDNLCVFDKLLDADEIAFLYNNGDGTEDLAETAPVGEAGRFGERFGTQYGGRF